MRLNLDLIKPTYKCVVSRAFPATAIAGFLLVMGLVGGEDMAEQQRAADAYSERVCNGLHSDTLQRNPECEQVASK